MKDRGQCPGPPLPFRKPVERRLRKQSFNGTKVRTTFAGKVLFLRPFPAISIPLQDTISSILPVFRLKYQ